MNETWHVYPVGDLMKHTLHGSACLCHPNYQKQPNGNIIITHHAFDGREKKEQGKKPN